MKKPVQRAVSTAITAAFLLGSQPVRVIAGDNVPARRLLPPDAGLSSRLRHLTLDDAIDIALRRNPDILRQLQEIQRNKGVYVEVRSQALPHLTLGGTFTQQDEGLIESRSSSGSSGSVNVPLLRTVDPATGADNGAVDVSPLFNALLGNSSTSTGGTSGSFVQPDRNYQITLQVTQTVYNAAIPPAIRQAKFTRDNSYYQLRETVDTTVNNVKTQFYGVLLDRGVDHDSGGVDPLAGKPAQGSEEPF